MKKTYYLFFYKIYHFFDAISDDNWADWKSYVIISCSEILLFIELLIWYTIATKVSLDVPKLLLILISVVISIGNYHLFLHNNRWKEYEQIFESYSKLRSKFAGWIVFLTLLCILSSLIFAFYQLSLIDWGKYK